MVAAKLLASVASVLAATFNVLLVDDCTLSCPPLLTLAPLAMLVSALLKTAPYIAEIITGEDPFAPTVVAAVVALVCVLDCSNTSPAALIVPPTFTDAVENART